MGMFSDIVAFFKAVFTDLGNIFDVYPKKKKPLGYSSDDEEPSQWGPESYEPWDFLSEEQWEEILRGDKSLDDFTTNHVWPPEKQEDNNIVEVEQENEWEQEGPENAESSETDDSTNSGEDLKVEADASESSGALESDFDSAFDSGSDCDSANSGSYDGYIG